MQMMPGGMNGVELTKEIRSRRKDLPKTNGYPEAAKQAAETESIKIPRKPNCRDSRIASAN
ncbi:hypothetical protein [Rhizobium leguminosarum]|uniref:hypothetical protein n=1 Tax=Rhizobium leguminosarum TaxID=384 RepID=UPI001C911017|nr:hypothetical protein [Rhizobium leguminosarum]MBY2910145.1 hypothetical protein [Rhizobium leguminosarum]MBY2949209.1 hypothetical protein [Rhizobium leguminosarum]MBY3001984.1 hypothetical protein [Rhizobium leguminosarum]